MARLWHFTISVVSLTLSGAATVASRYLYVADDYMYFLGAFLASEVKVGRRGLHVPFDDQSFPPVTGTHGSWESWAIHVESGATSMKKFSELTLKSEFLSFA